MAESRSMRPARCAARVAPALLVALTWAALAAASWHDALRTRDLAALARLAATVEDVDAADARGRTALMVAAAGGDVALLARLLALGAEVDRRNHAGGTALMFAVQHGHLEAAQTLLKAGASVDLVAAKGWTALMIAVLKGREPMVELLLAHGADPNVSDMHGWTPLMRALDDGREAIAHRLLLLPQVRLDVAGTSGRTALHIAAARGRAEAVRMLLARGVDPAAPDGEGRTALELAEQQQHDSVIALLRVATGAR